MGQITLTFKFFEGWFKSDAAFNKLASNNMTLFDYKVNEEAKDVLSKVEHRTFDRVSELLNQWLLHRILYERIIESGRKLNFSDTKRKINT